MSDTVSFTDNRLEVEADLGEHITKFLHEAAAELQAQVARNSRVDTGQTKGSWETAVDESAKEARVGSSLENAIWEELGTGEYAINGDGRKTPWAYVDSHGQGHYTHGKQPNRALQTAVDTSRDKITRMAESALREVGK